jgi:hypothetical protein
VDEWKNCIWKPWLHTGTVYFEVSPYLLRFKGVRIMFGCVLIIRGKIVKYTWKCNEVYGIFIYQLLVKSALFVSVYIEPLNHGLLQFLKL